MTDDALMVLNPEQGLFVQQAVQQQIRQIMLTLIGSYTGKKLEPLEAYAGIAAIAALHNVYYRLGKSQDSNHEG